VNSVKRGQLAALPPVDENCAPVEVPYQDHKRLIELGERRTAYILRHTQGRMMLTDMLAAAYAQGMTDAGISLPPINQGE